MEKFEINILGCGSALSTTRWHQTSQVINVREKLYMIDCGEGTQLQMRKQKLKFNKLSHIFISHLHGDHCFGLPGLISTMGLLGRKTALTIHSPHELEIMLEPLLRFFCKGLNFEVILKPYDSSTHSLIYEDKGISVFTIPLKHRIPCCGFLFQESKPNRHLIREMIDFYKIPIKNLKDIREGLDFTTEEGEVIPNSRLTRSGGEARSYAYCSDTAYTETILPFIQNVDVLFHESTFCQSELDRAKETAHSTALQAATIAQKAHVKRLIIGHYSARYNTPSSLEKEAQSVFMETHGTQEGEIITL